MKKGVRSLTEALLTSPPAPCGIGESTCVFNGKCASERLACNRFVHYVENEPPRLERRLVQWQRIVYRCMTDDDQPTRENYDRVWDGAATGRPKLRGLSHDEVDAIKYQLGRGVKGVVLASEFMVDPRVISEIKAQSCQSLS